MVFLKLVRNWLAKWNELHASKQCTCTFPHFHHHKIGSAATRQTSSMPITYSTKMHSPSVASAFALICALAACMMTAISISAVVLHLVMPRNCHWYSFHFISLHCFRCERLMQFENNDYYSERGSFERENYYYHGCALFSFCYGGKWHGKIKSVAKRKMIQLWKKKHTHFTSRYWVDRNY